MNDAALILVHGAWHDGSCWAPVVPLLQAGGATVLTPDLPGHGHDSLPLQKVTLKRYVSRIVELLDAQDRPVVLVGHSMAGIVISAVAAQRPDRIARLVYLCAYLPRDGESVFDLIALNRQSESPTPVELALEMSADRRSCTIARERIVPLFYPEAAPEAAETARENFGIQATLPLSTGVNLGNAGIAGVPTTYVCCTRDPVIPVHHQRRMLARQPCDRVLTLDADHSPFLSCPAALARLLLSL